MSQVAVLFARSDSVYKSMGGCDVWDAARDALLWPGGVPVVAHPPCRAWGRLRKFAQPRQGERDLAIWAVSQVQQWGGVLEHPDASQLWPAASLPAPGSIDKFGGWTLPVKQFWWGHRAEKKTLLYVVGCAPGSIPEIPLVLGEAPLVIANRKRHADRAYRGQVTKAEREATPPDFARWLVALARSCG